MSQKALSEAQKRVHLYPMDPSAWKAFGTLLLHERPDEAVISFTRALSHTPKDYVILELLAQAQNALGNEKEALESLEHALAINPGFSQGHFRIASMLYQRTEYEQALFHIEKADTLTPGNSETLACKGNISYRLYRFDEALATFEALIQRHPQNYGFWNNVGNVKRDTGKFEEADTYYQRSIALAKNDAVPFSNRLTTLHYRPEMNREEIFKVCKEWQMRFAAKGKVSRPVPPDLSQNRKIRIGMFSDGFRAHPVGWMSTAALENLQEHEIELYAYSTSQAVDHLTQRIKQVSTKWTPIQHLSDENFAQLIRDDQIDILIDLCGHNAGNRMQTMVMEPAPILVKWVGGLINTTGVEAIDYLLTDAIETPVGEDLFYTEKLIRMPDDYICFTPPPYAPPVASLPALKNGYITLGCFNNPIKINDVVLTEWSMLMQELPDSQLFLKGHQFANELVCQQICDHMAKSGIAAERLLFEGQSKHQALLETYNRIDIALDPWPYSGGLTTCEAMLMGVPVVTLPGPTFAGRHSATHLVNAGMPELVVNSWDEYRKRVIELASDLNSLSTIRTHLRDVLLQSPVCDGPRFGKHFTTAMRAIWQRYCEGKSPAALTIDKQGDGWFEGESESLNILRPALHPAKAKDAFSFSFTGKIITLDNGAMLVGSPQFTELRKLSAFTTIVFDPTSKVKTAEELEQQGDFHYFPHAVLGDGKSLTMFACLDPNMSSTIEPLPIEQQLSGYHEATKVIAKLSINSQRLDGIDGLESIDWLLLDNKNDSLVILENGEQTLRGTLLVQARINFATTHYNQPEFSQVNSWLCSHGFKLYRLNNTEYYSHLPAQDNQTKQSATQQIYSDAIFLPNDTRMAELTKNQKLKLAFILHTVYGVEDLAYKLIKDVEPLAAIQYLEARRSRPHPIIPQVTRAPIQTLGNQPTREDAELLKWLSVLGTTNLVAGKNNWERLEEKINVVDIGANPIDGTPPYKSLLDEGKVNLIGFEPQKDALAQLNKVKGPNEIYLPHAVGDGKNATLYICQASGMTSTLKPNDVILDHFQGYPVWAKVLQKQSLKTIRLDDVNTIKAIDWLKIDIQGGELTVFRNGVNKLRHTLVIQTEVNFIPLYENQPLFAEVDQWMREHGFMLHTLLEQRRRLFAPYVLNGQIHEGINQLTTADAVYIRDINSINKLTSIQRQKMACILDVGYGSDDLVEKIMKI